MRASALCTLAPAVCFQGRPAEAHAIACEAAAHAERNGRPLIVAATSHIRLQASLYTGARPTMTELISDDAPHRGGEVIVGRARWWGQPQRMHPQRDSNPCYRLERAMS